MIYSVTLKAFGLIRTVNIEAKNEADALFNVQMQVGYTAEVTPCPHLDHTHTGAVTARVR